MYRLLPILLFALAAPHGRAAEPEVPAAKLPRIAPHAPQEALKTFELKVGLQIELAAHEPLVEDPIDACFDADGHLYVVEMRGYSERRDERRGRIRLLKDNNDDGIFDHATVFAEGLRWPSAVQCFDGGVFVIATPDLFYFKDRDGDGIAEHQETIFTGFGAGKSKLNMQALANSLRWGPDNRIWGASAGNGGKIGKVNLNDQDFSFDPRTRTLRAENGSAQYGLSFDTLGRRYVCRNSSHLIAVMWERSWTRPGRYYSLPKPLVGIAHDGGAAPVFRISPDEPWRIVRTRWRVSGVVRGMVEGGGRVSGYFTGASGVHIYTGDALGAAYVNNAFTGDVGSNLLHRKVIERNQGLEPIARRPPDESTVEFLASIDNWFRPVSSISGPDGCLYLLDMYREVIEHPWSLPPGIKKHLDLNSGTDRGRIYRIQPSSFTRRKTPALSTASNEELVELLNHPNGWHRRTAQRLLFERSDPGAGAGWGRTPEPRSQEARFRQALALAKETDRGLELTQLASYAAIDPWMHAAILNAVNTPADARILFKYLGEDPDAKQDLMLQLAGIIGSMRDEASTQDLLSWILEPARETDTTALLSAWGNGLVSAGSSLVEADPKRRLRELFGQALARASDDTRSEELRIQAIRLATLDPESRTNKILAKLYIKATSPSVQLALIEALVKRSSTGLVDLLLNHSVDRAPQVKAAAKRHLLSRSEGARALLSAQREAWDLTPGEIDQLRRHRDPALKYLAHKRFPPAKAESPATVLARYQPALDLRGDAKKGAALYRQRCVACHRFKDEGFAVGPDLVSFKAAGRETILNNLIDPNREVPPPYQAFTFELTDGTSLLGLIAHETTREVTIRQAFGAERTLPRKVIKGMKGLGKSLMPEGLEAGLGVSEIADLLAFIETPI